MTDKIEVAINPAPWTGGGARHQYLLYARNVGAPDQHQIICEAGPGALLRLTASCEPFDPAAKPDPQSSQVKLIAQGDDLSIQYNAIANTIMTVNTWT